MMSGRWDKLGRRIRSFVDDPTTNLVKGLLLMLIGISEASDTFRDDLMHGHLRVGHGLIIIGLFSILEALPHFISSLEAWDRYLDLRDEGTKEKEEPRP